MYKQFLMRFPDQSIPLAAQVIDNVTASGDVKIFKKTSALITLNQAVSNQMFLKSSDELNRSFTQKMFAFLEAVKRLFKEFMISRRLISYILFVFIDF